MKSISFLFLFILAMTTNAQKQTFGVVSFTVPKDWQQQKTEGGIQLSVTDKKSGAYAIAVITKAITSTATANENFTSQWATLVKTTVNVNEAPSMSDMDIEKGWECIIGQANYTNDANKGLVTLVCATGYGQSVSVVLMTNTSKYQNELLAFINSLQLSKPASNTNSNTFSSAVPAQTNISATITAVNSPITGKLWEGTSSEKFTGAGTMTGHYTGGFSTMQYKFNADGSYRFVNVLASFYTATKTLGYETGTYVINGNQLTINPTKGQNEEWSKIGKTANGNSDVSNRAINETWNKKIKASARKLEKYIYTFSIGKNGNNTALVLQRSGHTEREGEGNISYLNETLLEKSINLPTILK